MTTPTHIFLLIMLTVPLFMIGVVLAGWLKRGNFYADTLGYAKRQEIHKIKHYFEQQTKSQQKKDLRILQSNPDSLCNILVSEVLLNAFLHFGFDINSTITHRNTPSEPFTRETLFTFALQYKSADKKDYVCANMLLNKYQHDYKQLTEFEAQVRQSGLQLYQPLLEELRAFKEKIMFSTQLVPSYQSPYIKKMVLKI